VIAGVADTHTALWYPRLSVTARDFMDDAARAGHDIVVSPISLAEIVYLVEKGRLEISVYHDLKKALADPEYVIEEAPFSAEVIDAMWKVPAPKFRICPTAPLRRRRCILTYPSSVATGVSGRTVW
jgi:PIN domain nuclease of toxin-antitoxin system